MPVIRQAALADPVGFVDYPDMMVIDEIQRVPELLLPIKVQVDNDGRPGRYLLSGSARVLRSACPSGHTPRPDGDHRALAVLAGGDRRGARRVHRRDLRAQGRISGMHPRSAGPSTPTGSYAAASPRRLRGPARAAGSGSMTLTSPIMVARDVTQLSDIERTVQMRALIRLLAARSGQLLVASSVGSEAGILQATALRYISLLEEVFLIKRIPAWSRNVSTRVGRTAKVAFVDSESPPACSARMPGRWSAQEAPSGHCSKASSSWNSRARRDGRRPGLNFSIIVRKTRLRATPCWHACRAR